MTEKSEDQVIDYCRKCSQSLTEYGVSVHKETCDGLPEKFIPQQYLFVAEAETDYFQKELEKVRSDLAAAVEALREIKTFTSTHDACARWDDSPGLRCEWCEVYKLAKEALGKIGVK